MHLLTDTWLRAKHYNTQKILLPYRFCGDSHHAFAFPFVLIFLPLSLSCKESSTSNQAFSIVFTTPSIPLIGDRNLRRKDVTALRCSEPLRYKVGGASKPSPWLCGMGPPGVRWGIGWVLPCSKAWWQRMVIELGLSSDYLMDGLLFPAKFIAERIFG